MLIVGTDIRIVCNVDGFTPTHPSLNDASLARLSVLGHPTQLVARLSPESVTPTQVPFTQLTAAPVLINSEHGRKPLRIAKALIGVWRVRINKKDVVYVRLPETIGIGLGLKAVLSRASIVSHVVASPDALSGDRASAVLHKLATFVVRRSVLVAYVTRSSLQQTIPPGKTPSCTLSNVFLPEESFLPEPRSYPVTEPPSLVTVASLNGMGKGVDTLIWSIKHLSDLGFQCRLSVVGQGSSAADLKDLAEELGVSHLISFLGQLGREKVISIIDSSDIFVLASRSEGLPRAMLEAMARGVICLGTNVGGIPELLEEEQLFAAGDHRALATLIMRCVADSNFAADRSRRQLSLAKGFEWNKGTQTLKTSFESAISLKRRSTYEGS